MRSKNVRDRPAMSSVVFKIRSEGPIIPQPKEPGFFSERISTCTDLVSTIKEVHTDNSVSTFVLQAI